MRLWGITSVALLLISVAGAGPTTRSKPPATKPTTLPTLPDSARQRILDVFHEEKMVAETGVLAQRDGQDFLFASVSIETPNSDMEGIWHPVFLLAKPIDGKDDWSMAAIYMPNFGEDGLMMDGPHFRGALGPPIVKVGQKERNHH